MAPSSPTSSARRSRKASSPRRRTSETLHRATIEPATALATRTAPEIPLDLQIHASVFQELVERLKVTRRRTMREFAESEIVIPDGRFKGMRFRSDRNPWAGVVLDAIDQATAQRLFNRFNLTGPSQQGKTLIGFVIPIMYHLFEIGETVVVAVPTMDMWADKWASDLLPVIRASRYADLLPTSGDGSKGGAAPSRVDFGNGATLRVLTGGGSDKSVAGFTARVLVVTETEGFDKVAAGSREADRLRQLEARTKSWDDDAVHYYECTVGTEEGRVWQFHVQSTESRLSLPCPHCSSFVTLTRECLKGWKDAPDEVEASKRSAFHCPECEKMITDEQRFAAQQNLVLSHKGQRITPLGELIGDAPKTKMLSIRFTSADSSFVRAGTLGAEEWKAIRSADPENAEKEQRQFRWALPHIPSTQDLTKLDQFAIVKRVGPEAKGVIPEDCESIYVGIDLGKHLGHWTCKGFKPDGSPHVIDYGVFTIPGDVMAVEEAILQSLRSFRDEVLLVGWRRGDALMQPDVVLIDAGYMMDAVLTFAQESGPGFYACKGFGEEQDRGADRRARGGKVIYGAEHGAKDYEIVEYPDGHRMVTVNADRWKSWMHARLQTPLDKPGAMTLYAGGDHLSYARHLLSEKQFEQHDPKKGTVVVWIRQSKQNHHLDSTVMADVAGHIGGVRLSHEIVAFAAAREPAVVGPQRPSFVKVPEQY